MTTPLIELFTRGITAGEAGSPMNADFRVYALPPKRVNRVRILAKLGDDDRTTTVPRPFTHAAPPSVLHPGPGENLEWFAFSARQHARDLGLTEWRELAELEADPDSGLRVRIGTKLALQNLRKGAEPPQSGHDNAHYFDDIATVRALAAVAVHGSAGAVDAAEADAAITHSLDGVWCARASAALFGALIDGASAADAVGLAVAQLPDDTWSRRMAESSLRVAAEAKGPMDRARRLSTQVGDFVYSYPIAAPETFGFLLAHVATAASADDLLLGALAQPRNAASLPALAGAAAAVLFGEDWIPEGLEADGIRLTGLGIPSLAGRTVAEVVAG
ncbi:ADP-ribosylglycohydrolase family protein [Microbacterium sp. EST19A]|uniref:ADP-ribosylglycohydrolase family protein n=1 Tax=Microbacterium sp. EST19A TaxID=2862681 RepID=UPI001CBAFA7B|nr:ADP-ribosylglycohydrolase family protein [Microbacterium sp. EST19A]